MHQLLYSMGPRRMDQDGVHGDALIDIGANGQSCVSRRRPKTMKSLKMMNKINSILIFCHALLYHVFLYTRSLKSRRTYSVLVRSPCVKQAARMRCPEPDINDRLHTMHSVRSSSLLVQAQRKLRWNIFTTHTHTL